MIQGREQNGKLIISLAGVIDSSNAASVEKKLNELYSKHPCDSLELDCDKLEYCTSAGLRVILRLKQRVPDTVLTNVHKALYKIFYITGFTRMIEVRKAYRVVSVGGCEVIGQGANGKVYRIDLDTVVKVCLDPDALPEIHRERQLARLAFVAGVPTAISYDVVRIEGGGYGSVFELLNAICTMRMSATVWPILWFPKDFSASPRKPAVPSGAGVWNTILKQKIPKCLPPWRPRLRSSAFHG